MQSVGPLCRGSDVPGVYFVRLLRGTDSRVLCFRDNWFTGVTDVESDEEIDLELVVGDGDDLFRLSDRHEGALPPPWSMADVERYATVPSIGVTDFVTLSIVTHSPLGNVEVTTRYESGRPVERSLRPFEPAAQHVRQPDLLICRRLSATLLRAAGMIDVLSSFEGGTVEGDWSKLMLLAGIVEGPEMLEANAAGRLSRPELAALALFSELWARGAVPEVAARG